MRQVVRFCYLLAFGVILHAQLDTGTISGTVTDSTDALIPRARVILTNELTGATREVFTNEQGYFRFTLVPAGQYSLQVEGAGFKTFRQSGIQLRVNEQLSVPVRLQVGETREAVEVTATIPLVDLTSGSLRETVDHMRITELPLNGRNVLQLQSLLPGVVPTGSLDQAAGTPGFSVNGGIGASNNYSLDGGEYLDHYFNAPLPFPNPDAIQEFTIQTSSYSAEFGRNRGASVNAVTKSGTNKLHGGLFHFLRNDVLDARPFFAAGRPAFKRNQFGAHLGGPVIRNRLFFFGAWQGTHQRGTPNSTTINTPSAAMRTGDFSELGRPIRDPLTNQPFPGARIPQFRLDPAARQFLERFVPLPNAGERRFTAALNEPMDGNQYLTRVDYELGPNDRLYGRYILNQDEIFGPQGNVPGFGLDQTFVRQSASLNETHTFGATLVNNVSFTFNRVRANIDGGPKFLWSDLGARIPVSSPLNQYGRSIVNVTGYFMSSTGVDWRLVRHAYLFNDTLSWQYGRHFFKFGTQLSLYTLSQINDYLGRGQFTFSGFATGEPAADLILGRAQSFQQASLLTSNLRQPMTHFFVQDEMKVSRRLSVNLGLRWEPNLRFSERDKQMTVFRPGEQSRRFPTAFPGLLYQGDPQLPPEVLPRQWKMFAPRVSFAYSLTQSGKTSLRGGYGVFFDNVRTINFNRFPLNQPFVLNQIVNDVQMSDPYGGAAPFPYTRPSTPEQIASFRFLRGAGATVFNPDFTQPYSQQWNLNIQHQLAADLVFTAAYVGSKSTHLFLSHNINPAVFGPGASVANIQARRLYPDYGVIEQESTLGYSQYHSLQLTANKRFSKSFTVLGSYTFSKNTGLVHNQAEGTTGPRNPWNWRLSRGLMPDDRTHIFTFSGLWMLPGLAQGPAALRHAVSGWELSSVITAYSGAPLTILAGTERSLTGQGGDTADLVGNPRLPGDRPKADKILRWFDPSAFALPPLGTFGTSGLSILRGPGALNLDLAVHRNFRLREGMTLQVRGQFYNLPNRTNLGNPVTSVSAGANFGRILNAAAPRVGEVAVKLSF
jgi:hypothetical protein